MSVDPFGDGQTLAVVSLSRRKSDSGSWPMNPWRPAASTPAFFRSPEHFLLSLM